MTTHINNITQCAVCGIENKYIVIGSTSTFGSSDLDTRPPEMERSILFSYVHRCMECGYCAGDLSKAAPQASSFIRNLEYIRQLADLTYPQLANSFLCDALIQQSLAKYSLACESAWNNDPPLAVIGIEN